MRFPTPRAALAPVVAVAMVTTAMLAGCAPSDARGSGPTISLVGFAVPKAANDAIETAWQNTRDGKNVSFASSYGASGDQSRAVEAGKKADYVHFSLEGDVTRLVKDGLIAPDWNAGPTKGIVSDSVVVLVVRKGNPKKIRGWDDIVRKGVGIVTPNPGSSGSARWNVLAAWAHATQDGGGDAAGVAFLTKFFRNAVTLAGSGREATTAFQGGTGDVLISYENEAIFARQAGEQFDYVVPDTTVLIENPGAVLTKATPKARDFLRFVLSDQAQKIFASKGFRPVTKVAVPDVVGANDPSDPFPMPKHLVTVADLGGWSAVTKKFFATKDKDGSDGLITRIQNESGKGNS